MLGVLERHPYRRSYADQRKPTATTDNESGGREAFPNPTGATPSADNATEAATPKETGRQHLNQRDDTTVSPDGEEGGGGGRGGTGQTSPTNGRVTHGWRGEGGEGAGAERDRAAARVAGRPPQ